MSDHPSFGQKTPITLPIYTYWFLAVDIMWEWTDGMYTTKGEEVRKQNDWDNDSQYHEVFDKLTKGRLC